MRRYILLTAALVLFTLPPTSESSYLNSQEDINDVSQFLSLLQEQGTRHEVSATNIVKRRKSASVAEVKDKSKEKEKCKCQDRASKRLRREIKDVSFQKCQSPGHGQVNNHILELSNLTLTPKPLIAPGNLHINFNMDVREQLPKNIQIDVDVYKLMFDTLPVSVPCMTVRNVEGLSLGSCTYKGICKSIQGTACPTFQSNGLPCDCEEITSGHYSFSKPITYIIPNINSVFDVLVKGSYKMRAAITDSKSKRELGCVEATWRITKLHKDRETYRALFFKQRQQN